MRVLRRIVPAQTRLYRSMGSFQDHTANNLLCLCANCHESSDRGWDEATFRLYKKTPWILRRHLDAGDREGTRGAVTITIDMALQDFDGKSSRWLRQRVAGFLEIAPEQVIVTSVKSGSVKVKVELPEDQTRRLLMAFVETPGVVQQYAAPIPVVGVEDAGPDSVTPSFDDVRELLRGFLGCP